MTPFCSFSTVPVLVGLLRSGVPFGAAVSFLIASPLLNPVVLGLFFVLFGWRVGLTYAGLGFVLAVVTGVTWEKLGFARYVRRGLASSECGETAVVEMVSGFRSKLRVALSEGWYEFRRALPYLVVGVAAGSLVYGFVPSEWIATVAGPGTPLAVPVAAVIGAPLYVWPETMLPVGAALIEKGMSLGALMALVIGGAGCSIPEVTVLGTVFRPRLLAVFVATIVLIATLVGYTFTLLF